jgi:UDP-GlcNAc:undecaprenyl-phosphate GlcNAc-1-phosphate transferase
VTPAVSVLVVFAAAAGLTTAAVPVVRRFARGSGYYEEPVEDRWHRRPVPKLGGAAMALAFLVVAAPVSGTFELGLLLAAPLLMFVLGVTDDLHPMRPAAKFIGQVVAAGFFVWYAPSTGITGWPAVDAVLAVLWFVGITNAFNLLDNIDGLAAGVAAIAGASLIVSLAVSGHPALLLIALPVAAVTGVAAGFLVYNWHPATIFMGDGGSHLLGAFFASATLLAAPHLEAGSEAGVAIAILLLLVPCADTALVLLTRPIAGRSAFAGGSDHLSHRLVALGTDDRRAVLMLYAVTAAGGLTAIGLQTLSAVVGWALAATYAAGVAIIGTYLAHVDIRPDSSARRLVPLPSEITSRYRIYEVILDVLLIALAYYLGLVTRFRQPEQFSAFLDSFTRILPLVAALHVAALWIAGKYRRPAIRSGFTAALTMLRGGILGSAASVIAVLYLTRFEGYSRQAFAVAAAFVVVFLWSEDFVLRALDDLLRRTRRSRRQVIVYGAGRRGALAVRELRSDPGSGLTPAGLIDDDPALGRIRVEGLRVLGTLDDLGALLADTRGRVTTVVVAIRSLPDDRFDQLCATCERHGVEVQQLRFSLDEVATDRRKRAPGVIRFPHG